MTRRSITTLATVAAAAVGTLSLAGPVAAAAPAKRFDAKGAVVAKRPTTTVIVAATLKGQALGGKPGMATGAECRGYADAVNGLADQAEQDINEGQPGNPDAGPVAEAILTAGQARGCAFTVS